MDPSDSVKAVDDDIPSIVIVSSVLTILGLVVTTIWLCRQLARAYRREQTMEKAKAEDIEPLSESSSTDTPIEEEEEAQAEEDEDGNVAESVPNGIDDIDS